MRDLKLIIPFYIALIFISGQMHSQKQESIIDLAGKWSFQIDSLDQGQRHEWFVDILNDSINLPGSMAQNGFGDDISVSTQWTGNMWNDSLWYTSSKMKPYRVKGNVRVPFWLSPIKVYKNPAWYQKKVNISKKWADNEIYLYLERVHWESSIWIDNNKIGVQNSLGSAHLYNLTKFLKEGEHTITIRIDNRIKDIDVGVDAHSISDNTQTNWNGIVGEMKLISRPKVLISNVKLYPDIVNKKVKAVVEVDNFTNDLQNCEILFEVKRKNITQEKTFYPKLKKRNKVGNHTTITLEYPMGNDFLLWDEFTPNVYEMQISLISSFGKATQSVDFGMREFKTKGQKFIINGKQVFLRGTLESCIFPLTGYPPTNLGPWERIFKIIKSYGLNHMRFHSWCPPEAAFVAADKAGIYLQVEASAWTTIGDGKPIDSWLYKETDDIINAYGNHPSFVMMAYGNEPSGDNHAEYLRKFVEYFKKKDSRRVYTGGAGWPYFDSLDYYNNSKPRIQGWNQNLNSIINGKAPQTQFDYRKIVDTIPIPYVSHEMGQWCVYPNFKEIKKYTGILKPKNLQMFEESLVNNNLGFLADSLMMASGKLQVICYKADIEAALRTKNLAGFQLLDLHDFPGQGTALVGVLDAFWDEKGYVTAKEYNEFCNETVPLVRLDKRVYQNTETLVVPVEAVHYGSKILEGVQPTWTLKNTSGDILFQGNFDKVDIPIGSGFQIGKIAINLSNIKKTQQLKLTVKIADFKNSWDLWVYLKHNNISLNESRIKVISKLDPTTVSFLKNGGKVLLNVTKGDIVKNKGGNIGVGFSSVFWNTSWTKGQKPHTLGILCNPNHPALNEFPTDYHSNWQWWDAMSHSNAIVLDDFNAELEPIVRVIDDWYENRRTALIFEAKIGKGKLIISGVDLHTDLDTRIEAQQLLYSLKKYMISEEFQPNVEITIDEIESLFASE